MPIFHPWNEIFQRFGLFRTKTPQVGFQSLVKHLTLAIQFTMINRTQPECCPLQSEQLLPKMAQGWVPATHNGSRNSMQPDYFDKNLCQILLNMDFMRIKRPYLLCLSTTARIASTPLDLGRLAMKSMLMSLHEALGVRSG